MGDKVTRIDIERLRRVGSMLITEAPEEIADIETAVFDLAEITGQSVVDKFRARYKQCATAPFDPEGKTFRIYPGGVTLWSGFPGAGKSTLLRQFICHTLARGSSVFWASLEEYPEDALVRLACTAWGIGEDQIDGHRLQCFIDAYSERLRLWAVVGTTSHAKLLAVVRALSAKGTRHAVLDSMMCLDIPNDDLEKQRQFANLTAAVARIGKCHIHLVAHPRKLVSAEQELDLNDVAGARELGGIADNVIFVRRKLDKENYTGDRECTPMSVSIRKQRHGGGALGEVSGWLNRVQRQFHADQFAQPTRYLPDWAYEV